MEAVSSNLRRGDVVEDERLRRVDALNRFALAAPAANFEPEILFLVVDLLSELFSVTGAVALLSAEGDLKLVMARSLDGENHMLEPEGDEFGGDATAMMSSDVAVLEETAPIETTVPLARWLDDNHPGHPARGADLRRALVLFRVPNLFPGGSDLFLCRCEATAGERRVPSVDDVPFLELVSRHLKLVVSWARERRDLERKVESRTLDLRSANVELASRLAELRSTQAQLVEASRKAGMADVASSVLHNVGNVLNSVNVSTELLAKMMSVSKGTMLEKAIDLWRTQPDPVRFLTEDPRGPTMINYLFAVTKALGEERAAVLEELAQLTKNVEHIKVIVKMQQSHAKAGVTSVVSEELLLGDLIDDALKTCSPTKGKVRVTIERAYEVLEPVSTDRHKLLQILVNLLSNAEHAALSRPGEPRITVRTRALPEGGAAIDVADNGIGIARADLDKIFSYGFTTKPEGHGFGLHSCACAAIELGGSLSVHSDGIGQGACFTVVLPARAP